MVLSSSGFYNLKMIKLLIIHLFSGSHLKQLLQEKVDVDVELEPDLVIVSQSWFNFSGFLSLTHLCQIVSTNMSRADF